MRLPRRGAAAAALLGVLALAAARPLAAQSGNSAGNSECTGYTDGRARNICNAAIDGTRYFFPVAGTLISGGNPVLGSGGALGGLGHFSVGVRANAVRVTVPQLNYGGASDTVASGDTTFVPAPSLDAAVGLLRGFGPGLLAVDALGSVQLLPTDQIDNFRLDPNATTVGGLGLGLGFGARIGLLGETLVLPGVSVSVMRRNMPQLQYGNVDLASASDDYSYAIDLHTVNVRLTASKKLAIVNLAAGLGIDHYSGDATIQFRDPALPLVVNTVDFKLSQTREVVFANAGFDMRIVKLIGELGYQTGKDQKLSTTFQGIDTKSGTMFGGVGLQVGL
jgi:hypothetical protein